MRSRLVVAVLIAPLLALAGCAATVPTPMPSPPRTSAAVPTPEAEASGPTPRFDLDCEDLEPPAVSAFVEAVAPRDPIATYAGADGSLPRLSPIQAIGGLVCEWSNGISQASSSGSAPGYAGLLLTILPAATAQWERYATTYQITESRSFSCADESASCHGDELVGEYWMSASADGVADDAAIDAALAGVASALAALPASRPVWTPPATTVKISPDCTALITPVEVATAVGLAAEINPLGPHGGWSSYAAAAEDLGVAQCFWSIGDEEHGPGSIAAIPGGAVLGNAYLELAVTPVPPTPLAVDGLAAGDSAWQRCSASACHVDLIAGGNWIQFELWAGDDIPAGLTSASKAIAEAVLARLAR